MEDNYQIAFSLILHAGNGKSLAMNAIQEARKYNFVAANEKIDEALKELTKAHHIQTELIQKEASGEAYALNLIMIHAQDHLSNGMMCVEQAKEFIHVYEELKKLKEGEKNENI